MRSDKRVQREAIKRLRNYDLASARGRSIDCREGWTFFEATREYLSSSMATCRVAGFSTRWLEWQSFWPDGPWPWEHAASKGMTLSLEAISVHGN